NNDRPGVMLASAARIYLNRFAVLPGKKIIVATSNDGAWRAAFDLADAGAEVTVADLRAAPPAALAAEAARLGVVVRAATRIVDLRGGHAVRRVTLNGPDGQSEAACDLVCASGGWSPTVHLTSHLGVKPQYRDDIGGFVPGAFPADRFGAGSMMGNYSTADAIEDGHRAGIKAASFCGESAPVPAPSKLDLRETATAPLREIPSLGRGKAFVDFQMDVTTGDIELAHREGYESVEHLKRYTTLGMATDQGKSSNIPGLAIMAEALGKPIPEVGTTRFRPPFSAVSIGSLAAERFGDLRPERLTPMHDWHVANGATMYSAGLWYRPMIYGHAGETIEQAYVREAKATRESAGIVDVSTLGKIAVQGPDAAEFLDRVYTNMFSTLAVGKARYGLMLREDGLAFDDGTTWRLGEQDFLMTTTTANAGKVMQHLEYFLDVIWPELKVHVTSVTDQWAGAAIGGPKARAILAACVTGTAVDNAALPFMGIVHGKISGAAVMICRLSFSGEMAFEVYSGAGYGTHVW
ncbi:MAG: sarcosine oxidase subunit alpha family protein, partial [Mesorhizobium sp.]